MGCEQATRVIVQFSSGAGVSRVWPAYSILGTIEQGLSSDSYYTILTVIIVFTAVISCMLMTFCGWRYMKTHRLTFFGRRSRQNPPAREVRESTRNCLVTRLVALTPMDVHGVDPTTSVCAQAADASSVGPPCACSLFRRRGSRTCRTRTDKDPSIDIAISRQRTSARSLYTSGALLHPSRRAKRRWWTSRAGNKKQGRSHSREPRLLAHHLP